VFERVVIGIDPGVAATGLAVVGMNGRSRPKVVKAETVRTPAGAAEAGRLRSVHRVVAELLSGHRPEAVALERLMWGRNVGSAMSVAWASGVAMLAAAEAGVPVHEYAPLEVKMAVTGDGGARKEDVRRALGRLHGIADVPSDSDAADAVAVAVCHLQMARGLRAAGAGG
jgi:crossover junction endodeoxyribonuclease RuvC